ncbi:MAG: Ig-like domain-containing protein, partial [Ruminococcus sp.]|nr:Ig-like domain-containing protein [Ruminococcus sp.]
SGKIKGYKAGTAKIAVKSGTTKLTFTVTVKNPTISAKKATLLKDKKKTLKVTGGSGTITWTSSDKNVATVTSKGVVTAKGYGTATIKAVRNGVTLSCTVTVYDPKLNLGSRTLKVGQTVTLKVLQSSGAKVTWKSDDKAIAKVNSKGLVTAVGVGKTVISATVDGVTLTCNIKVKAAS